MLKIRVELYPVEYHGNRTRSIYPIAPIYDQIHHINNADDMTHLFDCMHAGYDADAQMRVALLDGRKFAGFDKYMEANKGRRFIRKQEKQQC